MEESSTIDEICIFMKSNFTSLTPRGAPFGIHDATRLLALSLDRLIHRKGVIDANTYCKNNIFFPCNMLLMGINLLRKSPPDK